MVSADQLFTLSDASALAGVSGVTIRQYETDGLITIRRDSRNVRLFSIADIERIKQIATARASRHGKTGIRRRVLVALPLVSHRAPESVDESQDSAVMSL